MRGIRILNNDRPRKWLMLQASLAAALLVVVVLAPTASAGLNTGNGSWSWVNPSVQGNLINSLSFLDASTGWAAGTGGLVMKTTDGGDNWAVKSPSYMCGISPGSGCTLNSVDFIDANTGWVAGEYGTIYKTTDGGDNWSPQLLPGSQLYAFLNGVSFANANTGAAVGINSAFYTSDGGGNWGQGRFGTGAAGTATVSGEAVTGVTITNGGSGYFSATVSFSGGGGTGAAGTATVSGGAVTGVTITNGGSGYTSAPTVTITGGTSSDNGHYLQAVQMTSSTVGYAVGGTGAIYKTTNGGVTWTQQTSNTTKMLKGLFFTDSNNGFAVGQTDADNTGWLLRTTDGGATWVVNSATTINNRLRNIAIADGGSTLVITSEDGVVLRRSSANNWTDSIDTVAAGLATVNTGTTSDLSTVHFGTSSTGYAGGTGGVIFKTTDSGSSWAIKAGGNDPNLYSTSFVSPTTGWAAGEGGIVMKTADGGGTWSNDNSGMPSDVELHNIQFISATEGFGVGCRGTGCRYDGVTSVSGIATLTGDAVTGVTIQNSSSGWATAPAVSFSGGGGSGAAGTATIAGGVVTGVTITSGGSGYTSAPTVTFSSGGSTGVAYKYNSGTWTAMTVSGGVTSINGLHMADATHGLAVGSGGTALRTTDGTSWTPVSTGISSSLTLYSVDTMDPAANGWASGELAVSSGHSKGTIMKFNGSSWSQWDTGNTSGISWLTSIDMVNSTIGFVTGKDGKVYKTTDGGGSWNAQTTGTTKHLNSVSFLNRNVGFAVGEEGRVISTTNGGTTWTTGSLGTNLRMYGVAPVTNPTLPGVTAYTVGMSAAILKSEVVSATPPTPYHAWYDYGSSTVGLNLFDAATGYAPTQVWYSGAGNWNWSLSKTTIADQNDDDLTELDVFYDYGGNTAGLYVLDPAATYPSSGYQPQRKWLSCSGCWEFNRFKVVTAADQIGTGVTDTVALYTYDNDNTGMFRFNPEAASGYEMERKWLSGAGNWDWNRSKILASANYDNDATTEIAILYDYGNANTGIYVFDPDMWAIEGYTPARVWLSGAGNLEFPRSKISVSDQNNDGKGDILILYDYGNASTGLFVSNPADPIPADVWKAKRVWYSGAGSWDWNRSNILSGADQNGDGRTEVPILYQSGTTTQLYQFNPAAGYTPGSPVWSGIWDWSRTKPI